MRHPLYKQIGGVVVIRSTNICGAGYIMLTLFSVLFVMVIHSNLESFYMSISVGKILFLFLALSTLILFIHQTLVRFGQFRQPMFIASRHRIYIRGSGMKWGYRPGEVLCKQILAAPLWAQRFIPTNRAPKYAKSVTVFPSDIWLLSTGRYYAKLTELGWFSRETL